MDLKLHRPDGCCHHSRRAFRPGEVFYSSLVRTPAGLERIDCAAECWQAPPENSLAWWRSAFQAPQANGPELAPVDVLLDVLEQLEGRPEDAPLRYLLALELIRRRVLRPVEGQDAASEGTKTGVLQLACRRRDVRYAVPIAPPPAQTTASVQDRLVSLLWSGGAA